MANFWETDEVIEEIEPVKTANFWETDEVIDPGIETRPARDIQTPTKDVFGLNTGNATPAVEPAPSPKREDTISTINQTEFIEATPTQGGIEKTDIGVDQFKTPTDKTFTTGLNVALSEDKDISQKIDNIKNTDSDIARAFKSGDLSSGLDIAAFRDMVAGGKNASRLSQLKKDLSKARGSDEGKKWYKKTINSVAEMLPAMAKGGAVSAIGTMINPIGGQAAGAAYWAAQGAGQMYSDMRSEGIPHATAVKIALPAGALYGGIETLQVGKLLGRTTKKQIGNIIKSKSKRILAKFAKEKGKDWVKENLEEIGQNIIQESAYEIARKTEGKSETGILDFAKRLADTSWETFKQSALPLALIGGPGAAIGARKAVTEQRKQDAITDSKPSQAPKIDFDNEAQQKALDAEQKPIDITRVPVVDQIKQDEVLPETTESLPTVSEVEAQKEVTPELTEQQKVDAEFDKALAEPEIAEQPLEGVEVEEAAVENVPVEAVEPAGKRKRRPSYNEFVEMTDPKEQQRIYEQNEVTERPGTPAHQRQFREATADETKPISATAGDVNGFKMYNDILGEKATDEINARIFDAAAPILGDDVLSNLHGDEYAAVPKKGETQEQLAMRIKEAANEVAKIEIELDGQVFRPTLKWLIGTVQTEEEFGKINPKQQGPNTIKFDKTGKGDYITIKAADISESEIVTRDKFEKGENDEIRLRRPKGSDAETKQQASKADADKDKIPQRRKEDVREGQSGVQIDERVKKDTGLRDDSKTVRGQSEDISERPQEPVQSKRETGKEVASPKKKKYQDFLGNVASKIKDEEMGQAVLEDLETNEKSPQQINTEFWTETYPKLPKDKQKKFEKLAEGHLGYSPEEGESWAVLAAKDADYGDSVAFLEGTDRGDIALMATANKLRPEIVKQLEAAKAFIDDVKAIKPPAKKTTTEKAVKAPLKEKTVKKETKVVKETSKEDITIITSKEAFPILKKVGLEGKKTDTIPHRVVLVDSVYEKGVKRKLKSTEHGYSTKSENGDVIFAINKKLPTAKVAEILTHEIIGHYGADKVLGRKKGISKTLDKLYADYKKTKGYKDLSEKYKGSNDETLKNEWLAWHLTQHELDRTSRTDKRTANERAVSLRVYRIIKKAIRNFLVDAGVTKDLDVIMDRMIDEMSKPGKVDSNGTKFAKSSDIDLKNIKTGYEKTPDNLMGFSTKNIDTQKGYDETNYPYMLNLEISTDKGKTWESESIKGMNRKHAIERAKRNWGYGVEIRSKDLTQPLFAKVAGTTQAEYDKNLAKFMEGSKVVNEDGSPKVVYHGTSKEFSEFNSKEVSKSATRIPIETETNKTFAFSQNKTVVEFFANKARTPPGFLYPGSHIMDVYLSLKNPKIVDMNKIPKNQLFNTTKDAITGGVIHDIAKIKEISIREARLQGRDGIIFKNGYDYIPREGDLYFVFSPNQIKSASSNTGEFSPESDDIRFAKDVDKNKIFSKDGELTESNKDAFIRIIQDRFIRLKRIQDQPETKISEDTDTYLAEALNSSRARHKLDVFEAKHIKPFRKSLIKSGVKMEALEEYVYAKHAPERNADIAKIRKDMPDGGSGMKNKEAANILKEALRDGSAKKKEKLAKYIYDINNRAAALRYESGLISKEELNAWKKYDFYVPLRGIGDKLDRTDYDTDKEYKDALKRLNKEVATRPMVGKGFSVKGKESRRALGRRSRAHSIIAHSILNMNEAIIRSEKNKVATTFLSFVEDNPNDKLWNIDKPDYKPTFNKSKGEVQYKPEAMYTLKDNVMTIKRNGEPIHIEIKDPALASAMVNLGAEKISKIYKVFGTFSAYFSIINTALSPGFVFSNPAKDVQAALANMGTEQSAGVAKDILKNLPGSLLGSFQAMRDIKGGVWKKWYEEFSGAGGRIGFLGLQDVDSIQKDLIKEIKLMQPGSIAQTKRAYKAVKDMIMDVNGAIENATRLSTYVTLRKRGMSKPRAADEAKNVTVNFNRKGELGPKMNALYVFSNASVQGVARMHKMLKTNKGKALAASIAISGYTLAQMNRLLAGDDDDGENYYDKIPGYIKTNNWIIMRPGIKTLNNKGFLNKIHYMKFPTPYGYNIFYAAGIAIDEIQHTGDALGSASMIASAVANSYNPLGSSATIRQTITPTIFRWITDLSLNKNFFGAPIMQNNKFERKAKSHTFKKSTSAYSKEIAQTINKLSGGSKYEPGKIDISPDATDYIVEYLTGSVGKTFTRSIRSIANLGTNKPTPISNIPIVRRFVGSIGSYQDTQKFYDSLDDLRKIRRQYKDYKEIDKDKARKYYKEHEDELKYTDPGYAGNINKEIKSIRKFRLEKDAAAEKNNQKRVEELESLIEKRIKTFNKRYKQVTK